MFSWIQQRRLERARPERGLFDRVVDGVPILVGLGVTDRARLYERCTEILVAKSFQGGGGMVPEDDEVLLVAVLAALPVLELGVDWYRGFHTFILYPAEFVAEMEEMDDAGLVHTGSEVRSGEAWAYGPVVLGMDEVRASGQGDGFNVVAHELAHQIDQLNGDMDGFPPLRAGMDPKRWTTVFTTAYARLVDQVERGVEPSMDPYGAESPAEFFAVACEFFFDVPDYLEMEWPGLFLELEALFRSRIKEQGSRRRSQGTRNKA
jgi:Mlc titration factor MtfA (ptsG expression regulator)